MPSASQRVLHNRSGRFIEACEARRLLASISGVTFNDRNVNGLFDTPDTGATGRTVWADLNDNGSFDAGESSTTSQSSGSFQLTGVPNGTFPVRQALPFNFVQTAPAGGGGQIVTVAGSNVSGVNLGSRGVNWSNTARGIVYFDVNRDGTRTSGEGLIQNRIVYVDANQNGERDPGELNATTNSEGQYEFLFNELGTYPIRAELPEEWVTSQPIGGGAAMYTPTALDVTETAPSIGQFGPSILSGTVFDDSNGNGALDAGESPSVAGRTVWLDLNNDAVVDPAEPIAVTSANGFRFKMAAGGNFMLRYAAAPGTVQTSPPNFAALNIGVPIDGATAAPIGARPVAGTGTITGKLIRDDNRNGIVELPEVQNSGLVGRTIFLDLNFDTVRQPSEPSTLTGVNGVFAFADQAYGKYAVRVEQPPGWGLTFPSASAGSSVDLSVSLPSADFLYGANDGAPQVVSSLYLFEQFANRLAVNFDFDVASTVSADDFRLISVPAGLETPLALTYTPAIRRAVLTAALPLPDGNYRLTTFAAGVSTNSSALAQNVFFDFFVLAGDANRDRSIDIGDFATLAGNFNSAGTFSEGDFDYSGTVDIGDFSILASGFNKTLAPPAARTAPGSGFFQQRVMTWAQRRSLFNEVIIDTDVQSLN